MLPVPAPFTRAEIAYRQQRIRSDFATVGGGRARRGFRRRRRAGLPAAGYRPATGSAAG